MLSFSSSGSTSKTSSFLKKMAEESALYSSLDSLAQQGVSVLQNATPKDSGFTASSWDYEIKIVAGKVTITWLNTHVEDGVNIAIILQYGHGTGTGGYVAGSDYINAALKPVFDQIANEVWKKVTTA